MKQEKIFLDCLGFVSPETANALYSLQIVDRKGQIIARKIQNTGKHNLSLLNNDQTVNAPVGFNALLSAYKNRNSFYEDASLFYEKKEIDFIEFLEYQVKIKSIKDIIEKYMNEKKIRLVI